MPGMARHPRGNGTALLALLVSVVAIALVPGSGGAQDAPPDAATIRERIRSAGGAPPAFRETRVTASPDGTVTTLTHVQRGEEFRDVAVQGPFHTERGSAHGVSWRQNDNGQTIVVGRTNAGRAEREPPATVVRVHTPIDAYVLATLDAAGFGLKRYVDPVTWRLLRTEAIGPNGTIATTFDDVREDHGRTFAHHWHTDDGDARTTNDTVVTAYDPGDVATPELAIPPSRRNLVEFPPAVRTVALPAQFGRAHIVVRVTIGGRGLDFLLDTGASGIFIDAAVAHELGLEAYGQRSTVGAGRYATARTIVREMRVGDLVMHDVAAQTIPQGWNESGGMKSVGLLGYDFLAELGVTIDYEHEQVTVVRRSDFQPPTDPHTTALDVRLGGGQPFATVSVNGAVGDRFVLDTGGAGPLLVSDAFASRHPEALRDGGGVVRAVPLALHGVGGAIGTRAFRIANLRVANVRFTDVVGYRITSRDANAVPTDGNLGPDFFRLFTVGLDYANDRIYLEPNASGRAAIGFE
ncbi:MAG: hypothetical protein NVS3B7_02200 [Candidatus Elarobacter sp.]